MNRTYLVKHNNTFNSAGQIHADNNSLLGYVIALVAFLIILSVLSMLWQILSVRVSRSQHDLARNSMPRSWSAEEEKARKQFVKSNLPHRRLSKDEGSTRKSQNDKNANLQNVATVLSGPFSNSVANVLKPRMDSASSGDLESPDGAHYNTPTEAQGPQQQLPLCAICLGRFQPGGRIAWSTNPLCSHEYHRDCIYFWLLKHVDCPICRQVFLPSGASIGSETTTEASHIPRQPPNLSDPLRSIAYTAFAIEAQRSLRQQRQEHEQQLRGDEEQAQSNDEDPTRSISEEHLLPIAQEQPVIFVEEQPYYIAGHQNQAFADDQHQPTADDQPQTVTDERIQSRDEDQPRDIDVEQPLGGKEAEQFDGNSGR